MKTGVTMGKFNLTEYIQEHLPKRISKEFELTGKKIRAKNLKANQSFRPTFSTGYFLVTETPATL